jgi:hypothetical protein
VPRIETHSDTASNSSLDEKGDDIPRTPHHIESEPVEPSALLNLPPPPPFDLDVRGLTVGVPRHSRLAKLLQGDVGALKPPPKDAVRKTTILEDVSCACASGQVLAM